MHQPSIKQKSNKLNLKKTKKRPRGTDHHSSPKYRPPEMSTHNIKSKRWTQNHTFSPGCCAFPWQAQGRQRTGAHGIQRVQSLHGLGDGSLEGKWVREKTKRPVTKLIQSRGGKRSSVCLRSNYEPAMDWLPFLSVHAL